MTRGTRKDGTRYTPPHLGGYQQRVRAPATPPPYEQALAGLSRTARMTMICAQRYYDTHERWPEVPVLRDLRGFNSTNTILSTLRELTRAGFLDRVGNKFKILRRVPDEGVSREGRAVDYKAALEMIEAAAAPFARAAARYSDFSPDRVPILTAREGVTVAALRALAAARENAKIALGRGTAKAEAESEPSPLVFSDGPLSDEENSHLVWRGARRVE